LREEQEAEIKKMLQEENKEDVLSHISVGMFK